MLLRYLFGLEGEMITNQAIGPDANRTSNEDIQAYLEAICLRCKSFQIEPKRLLRGLFCGLC